MSNKIHLSAIEQMLLHCALVFLAAFGGQMITSLTGVVKISALLALLTSSAAAGVTAVIHYVLGLIPQAPEPASTLDYFRAGAVPPVIVSKFMQFLVSVIATFLTIFGAALVAGATHVTSLPSVVDLVMAAISAGVAGVVSFITGLLPHTS